MMKSYLRFEPKKNFGIISSPQCNVIYDFTGNLAITGAVQDICVWNLRQASQIATLSSDAANYPYKLSSEVIVLERSPDKFSVAAGYVDGTVRIFNYLSKTLLATLRGHRSAVVSLCFNDDGTSLATGGADSDIIIWDIVSHTGICKLRGHKDAVTGVAFIKNESQILIVSVSKDTLLKVWDLETRACVQTVVGHRCEIWSLAVIAKTTTSNSENNADVLNSNVCIVTGSSDEFIRGYRLKSAVSSDAEKSVVSTGVIGEEQDVLEYYGCIVRANPSDKCTGLYFNASGSVLAAQCSGKNIELFRVRDDTESKKKVKRRLKRMREKSATAASTSTSSGDALMEVDTSSADAEALAKASTVTLSDEVELLHTIRCTARVRGFAFSPQQPSTSSEHSGNMTIKAMIGLINNSIEVYSIPLPSNASEEGVSKEGPAKISVIDMHGHRSDVRAVCVSGDGSSIATCSNEGVKIWSAKSNLCTSSCRLDDYCISMAYAPGGRYIIVGTKDGKLKILDSASGEAVYEDVAAHTEGSAIWSIAVRPDGKGFMTGGADKLVKFWDFSVSEHGLSAVLNRHLIMSHDVLSVRYSPNRSTDRLLVAVGLLDNTVKLFFDDSLKFFLSLYGHKLPIMCLDISYDCNILVSGSADKTIKIWGLDFGDCHRSLVAHEDSVTAIRFQPNTHYFFSAGKDGVIKYWDADRFEQVLFLPGHKGSIWGMELSPDGAILYSVGQDRSVRVWERGEDLVFVEEERERSLEAQVDKAAENEHRDESLFNNGNETSGMNGDTENSNSATAALKNIDSVKGGEMLMDALDLVEAELADLQEHTLILLAAEASKDKKAKRPLRNANPLLLGLSPYKYMMRALRQVKAPDLEQALIILPFSYVTRFISMLIELANRGLDIELCSRCAVFLLRCHQAQILHTQSLLSEMLTLRSIIGTSVDDYRKLIGANIAGLRYTQRILDERREDGLLSGFDVAALNTANEAALNAKQMKKANKKRAKLN